MLSQLYIQNIAIIEKVQVSFGEGLNIFTGETGAGKSIIIDAINAVLGSRTSRDLIRTGENKAVVTALFEEIGPATKALIDELGYEVEEDNSLLLSREITADGKNSCKVGMRPATVGILRQIAQTLINIHGQHDNQILLTPSKHLFYIDEFGKTGELLADYRMWYEKYTQTQRKLRDLQTDEQQKAHRIDLLSYQIDEIEKAEIRIGEEEELLQAKKKHQNSAKILASLQQSHDLLSGSEEGDGVLSLLDLLEENVRNLSEYYPDLNPDRILDLRYELDEVSGTVRDALFEVQIDPEEIDFIESRLDLIYLLKRKYGGSESEILAFYESAKSELETITHADELAEKYTKELAEFEEKMLAKAKLLSAKRQESAQNFSAQVASELAFLDMPSAVFEVNCQQTPPTENGTDQMEFYLSTNAGEPPKPISKIASGGELSRIMLALKNVIAEGDLVETAIFDEIDAGVSGRAAGKIGQKLKQVSAGRQVICVTHLAQVAAYADVHLLIQKQSDKQKTFTTVEAIAGEKQITELARIMGGELVSENMLASARELLEKSRG